ncbi:MAG: hypothetical protein RBQ71_07485 [Acholeplasmataceae bacterium]|jgi:hypothetical protein|nr:hypothetical protein [Acholeplasmataceae bacterium]
MLKWILRFFYIMIISVATLYVYGSANYGRLEAYYAKYMAEQIDNDQLYLEGINTLMNLEYHQETPVYTYVSESDTHFVKLSVYPIGISNEGTYYDGVMIFINQLAIYDDGVLVEKPILKITAHLSDATYKLNDELIDNPSVVFDSTKEFPYSYAPTLFLVYADDYLKIPETETFATIDMITVEYSTGARGEDGQYAYDTTMLLIATDSEAPEAAYNKATDMVLNESSFRLTESFGDDLSAEEIETLGLNVTKGSLKEFNGVIVKTMSIYGLIVIALTYIIFFHKFVVEKIRAKRLDKQQEMKEPGKEQEAIFQDIEYDEDGKRK